MSSTVTASMPRAANSVIARETMRARTAAFFRPRRPGGEVTTVINDYGQYPSRRVKDRRGGPPRRRSEIDQHVRTDTALVFVGGNRRKVPERELLVVAEERHPAARARRRKPVRQTRDHASAALVRGGLERVVFKPEQRLRAVALPAKERRRPRRPAAMGGHGGIGLRLIDLIEIVG